MADAEPQDAFMYFDPPGEVKGSTQDAEMAKKKAFEITNFTLTGENATNIGSSTGGGGGAGKVKFEKLNFTKYSDAATVGLILHMIQGVHTDKVIIELRQNGKTYLRFTFHMCLVSQVETTQSGEDEAEDTCILDWGAVHIEYLKQDAKGNLAPASEAMWSRVTNTPTTDTSA